MKNEIVKYKNEMNTLCFKGFNAIDLDVLMTLCAKMKDKNEDIIEFEFNYLKEIMQYKSKDKDRFVNDLNKMNNKLIKVTASFKTETKIIMFILFPTFEIDTKKETLKVRVNPDFKYLLNEISEQFTFFELQEFTTLTGKYSKNLYRLLKQYRTTGKYRIDINEFRNRMDIPDTYKNRDISEKVIKPSIEELTKLNYFKNLKTEAIKAKKKGSPVIAYEFNFEKESTKKKTKNKINNKFNDFEQKQDYDMDELEKQLEEKFMSN